MLELLVKYARDHDLDAEPGFKPRYARWAIMVDSKGRYLGIVELGDVDAPRNRGALFSKCPDLSHGELISGGETRCHFLVESAETVGLYGKGADSDKARAKHEYFTSTLEEAATEVPDLAPFAVALRDESTLTRLRTDLETRKARPTDGVTLSTDGVFIVESPTWHDWWRRRRAALAAGSAGKAVEDSPLAFCIATGRRSPSLSTHPKIEGLSSVGGLPTGDVLIGFDKEAFCSYGLAQSANAAVSEQGATAYRAALNELIRERGHRIAGTMIVHWFSRRVEPENDPLGWLAESMEQQTANADSLANKFLESVRTGEVPMGLAQNHYYALTLSGASGRVMVRDWCEGSFDSLAVSIARWFEDLAIVNRYGDGNAPHPKFTAVLGALVRDLADLSPPIVATMWRVAVRDEPFPLSALAQAVRRATVDVIEDRPANHARYALMKAFHLRHARLKGEDVEDNALDTRLSPAFRAPAYQCGRLMAVMSELQHRALGDVGAGLVQRYYAAASATPALVLGRLARLSQFHLGKLEPALARWYETELANIWASLDDVMPPTLTLREQSLFALGYYQQIAAMRGNRSSQQREGRS